MFMQDRRIEACRSPIASHSVHRLLQDVLLPALQLHAFTRAFGHRTDHLLPSIWPSSRGVDALDGYNNCSSDYCFHKTLRKPPDQNPHPSKLFCEALNFQLP